MIKIKHIIRTRAIIKKDGKILVLKEKNNTFGLPGGRLNKGETIEKALIREIKEETGLEVKKYKMCYLGEVPESNSLVIFYVIKTNDSDIKISKEHLSYEWMTLEQIENNKTIGPNFKKACRESLHINL